MHTNGAIFFTFFVHCSKQLGEAHGFNKITRTCTPVSNIKWITHNLKPRRKQKMTTSYANQSSWRQKPEKGDNGRNRDVAETSVLLS